MKNKKARSFVVIMIIIALSALLLRILIEGLITLDIAQNESAASSTLKLISAALENYAKDNHGIFPANLSFLIRTDPPYLDKDYISKSPVKGYSYSCQRMEPSGYSCSASPVRCNLNGKNIYTISTGGLFVPEECSKKD